LQFSATSILNGKEAPKPNTKIETINYTQLPRKFRKHRIKHSV
jgi:hypothetical protein